MGRDWRSLQKEGPVCVAVFVSLQTLTSTLLHCEAIPKSKRGCDCWEETANLI